MKLSHLIGSGLLASAMLTLSACYGPSYPRYGYGYGYSEPPPVAVYGAYDEHHAWHDSHWWVANRHDWVQHNHPEWIASAQRHDEQVIR